MASNYLLQFINSTENEESQKRAMAQAYFLLGRLFHKQNDHLQSEKYYAHYFALCVEISREPVLAQDAMTASPHLDLIKAVSAGHQKTAGLEEIGLAKMLLGIARGNARLHNFFDLVSNKDSAGFAALLDLKSGRSNRSQVE